MSIGFSYKTMTMLWCFGNFPVDLNLLIFMCLGLDFVGMIFCVCMSSEFGRSCAIVFFLLCVSIDSSASSDFRLRVMSGCDLQWVMTRLSRDKNLLDDHDFQPIMKFEPSEDFVQVILCQLWLLGSVVGTRSALCLIGIMCSLLTSVMGELGHGSDLARFIKLILFIQGLGSSLE